MTALGTVPRSSWRYRDEPQQGTAHKMQKMW
jgi:hypothetical protein